MENKERPILFNGEMVRAILDGRKTQTRRIAKVTSEGCQEGFITPLAGFVPRSIKNHISYCPFGKPGDRLWVRETWQGPLFYDEIPEDWNSDKYKTPEYCYYKASGDSCDFTDADDNFVERWSPSIHMPRWASRILLEVTNVRVERLNDISEEDARLEGITDGGCLNCGGNEPCGCSDPKPDARDAFIWLWESINGQGSWIDNTWVWVIEFKVIENGQAK